MQSVITLKKTNLWKKNFVGDDPICFHIKTVASGLGYNSNNIYPSTRGNSWNRWGSRGGRLFDNGGWDLGHHGGYGSKYYFSAVTVTVFANRICYDIMNWRKYTNHQ
jgi:hypothetical protein